MAERKEHDPMGSPSDSGMNSPLDTPQALVAENEACDSSDRIESLALFEASIAQIHTSRLGSHRLPPELLHKIFAMIPRREDVNAWPSKRILYDPSLGRSPWKLQWFAWPGESLVDCISVSQVCRYWRQITLASPPLWTDIIWFSSPHMMRTSYERARQEPIQLVCRDGMHNTAVDFFVSLSEEERVNFVQRIESIQISAYSVTWPKWSYGLEMIKGAAPTLRQLWLTFGWIEMPPASLDDLTFPCLTDVCIRTFPPDFHGAVRWTAPVFSNLTRLDVRAPKTQNSRPSYSRFDSILRSCPSLQRLTLQNVAPPDCVLDDDDEDPEPLTLDHLTHLCLEDNWDCLHSFCHLNLPSLHRIALRADELKPPSGGTSDPRWIMLLLLFKCRERPICASLALDDDSHIWVWNTDIYETSPQYFEERSRTMAAKSSTACIHLSLEGLQYMFARPTSTGGSCASDAMLTYVRTALDLSALRTLVLVGGGNAWSIGESWEHILKSFESVRSLWLDAEHGLSFSSRTGESPSHRGRDAREEEGLLDALTPSSSMASTLLLPRLQCLTLVQSGEGSDGWGSGHGLYTLLLECMDTRRKAGARLLELRFRGWETVEMENFRGLSDPPIFKLWDADVWRQLPLCPPSRQISTSEDAVGRDEERRGEAHEPGPQGQM